MAEYPEQFNREVIYFSDAHPLDLKVSLFRTLTLLRFACRVTSSSNSSRT
jgi:hypothetical protein